VTLSTSGTALTAATATLLSATASTYVRDGSYASTNYGGETTMTVKYADGAGYDRISLLKFDASSISGTVARAVLWVEGGVSDSAGSQTTLTAYGLSSTTWTETAVTWSTAPSLTTAYGTGALSDTADWVGLDVTSLVTAAAGGIAGIGVYQSSVGLATVLSTRAATNGKAPILEVITD
jgi:hyaluronate lyase